MPDNDLDPITFEILRHRLWVINDEAATTIGRVSGSQVATEANDVNTALMTPDGQVVVTGIYILVQVVSLSGVIQDILANYGDNPGIRSGDMFLTNDPYVGAPHQPDAIVVAPIFDGETLIAWSGSVVHQPDVGGPTAGSINVAARSIFEEPIPMPPVRIVEGGVIRRDIEREYLIRSRTPDLNALDLLGQVAANRLQAERVLELCARYGTDTLVNTLQRLVTATETQFRQRLASLPDGRFRHTAFMEHDGRENTVFAIRLTMTKRGEKLTLDFTESSDQAESGVNATLATTQNFAMAAVMALLGYGMPWVPAGFAAAVDLRTREGSVVHARWPAAVAMSVNAAGQEVRTCVNACIARLLDAAGEPDGAFGDRVLASCMSSAPAQTIAGRTEQGRPFGTMLLDGLLGGGGARGFADGADVSGILTSPGAACANIEVIEQRYPLRYLWRRERPDSGGPGRYRGGVSAEHGYLPHRAGGRFDTTVFSHGVEQPTSTGVAAGEPGAPTGMMLVPGEPDVDTPAEDVAAGGTALPAKASVAIEPRQTYLSWCAGGGGVGDPLDRPADEVLADVRAGLVSRDGAERDYGVVIADSAVDPVATDTLRRDRRRTRLGGRDPLPPADVARSGRRRLSSALDVVAGSVQCRRCDTEIGPATDNVRQHLVTAELPVTKRWPETARHEGARRFVFRRYFCPGCAAQVDTEIALRGEPIVHATELWT
ncbi:hydantoinase B/oxoprolinase family protein [Amycolatopsis taiwanensis]|uniref:Methylhydantoinase n=1 Tax=Amycolatopsis taiwanensis TaxID=342230 RepID=A0A9W6VG90_9PSEU|nr:hydantoinase B/oxoprolinase family protein [Amycolatopsis taiwanensis]GLY70508.1 methylhydantoinase [Amycolatopsis taiwanensis]